MKIGNKDITKEVFVIAEVGNNHEGSYTLAEEMIGLASGTGVDAVKFQTFKTEYFVSKKETDRFNRLKSFELTEQEFIRLSEHAQKSGLIFISTPLDIESAKFLQSIVTAYKIASSDNNFYPLLEVAANTGKPIILSSGLADIELLKTSKNYIENIWRNNSIQQSMAILHCVTAYPVPTDQVNLGAITALQKAFNCSIGYSDHTLGIKACELAVALGAQIIEKHFTMDKNYSSFRDHQLSADPSEMKQLVNSIKEIKAMMGQGEKTIQAAEKSLETAVRRSIAAKTKLSQGHTISFNDLMWIRPSGGLSPGKENLLLGKTLNQDVEMGEFLTENIIH